VWASGCGHRHRFNMHEPHGARRSRPCMLKQIVKQLATLNRSLGLSFSATRAQAAIVQL
jgi:hypothetical protein